MMKIEYRNLVFRKDSDKWHCFHAYESASDCLDHAAELTIDKPNLDFLPVLWRFDIDQYSVLDTD